MNSETAQKEIIHWNILTLQHLTSIVDLVSRSEAKLKPSPYDFRLRDFYFNPNFELFGTVFVR
jgi:hypothetical protein